MDKPKPRCDTTQSQRQSRRNAALNAAARAQGWSSLSECLTEVKRGTVELPRKPQGDERMREPSEVEKQMHIALADVVDSLDMPRQKMRDGTKLIALTETQQERINTAFELFTVIYGLKLQRGEHIKA